MYKLSREEAIKFFITSYLLMVFVSYVFYKSIFFSIFFGFSALWFYKTYEEYKCKKKQQQTLIVFKDMLYSISSSISAGRQMGECLEEAHYNLSLIYPKDEPLLLELNYIVNGIMENRDRDDRMLIEMSKKLNLEDIRNFAEVYTTCKSRGGNLKEVIDKASKALMEKLEIEREIKTLMAQKQFEGKIISIMPILIIFGLNVLSPEYLNPLYETVQGRIIMTTGLCLMLWAFKMTMKITDFEV